ncbi:MAG: MBL fold metallo-hydrolase [Clostridia bacterium]|nr:MBL fold metallo-hydrolase [Clostridia bacterium]
MIYDLGDRAVNNYLITAGDGYILIDTGYEKNYRRFTAKLKKYEIDPKAIKTVFLTHAHDDHAGFLNDVLAVTGAKVVLHPKAVAGLTRGQNSFEGGCSSRLAWVFCQILALFGHGEHRYPPIKNEYLDRLIPTDSEEFRALHFPYEILETPGHTSDHISLIKDGVMFCGDAAMNGFPSRKRVIIWIEDLKQYKSSWEKILETDAAVLCPAHGRPFRTSDLRKYLPSLDKIRLYPLKKKSK